MFEVREILLNGIQVCDGGCMVDEGEGGAATYDGKGLCGMERGRSRTKRKRANVRKEA